MGAACGCARGARADEAIRSAAPFVLLGLAFVLTLLLQKSFLVQSDEGYTLNAAWQMWNGMKMYDDFRLFVAPGAGCAVYAVWAMFGGPSFLSARVLSLLLSFSSIVAVYLILARRGVRGADAGRRRRRLDDRERPVRPAEPQHLQQLRGRLDAAGVAARAGARSRRGGPPARPRAGRRRGRDRDAVPADEGTRAARGGVGRSRCSPAAAGAACGRRPFWSARAAAVVAPLLLVWRPSVLLREWFLVPLGGQLPRSHRRVAPARRRRASSSPPRWRRSRSACAIGC